MSAEKKMVIVDDEPFMIDILRMTFAINYDVVAVTDPRDALKEDNVDVIVCDIRMPHVDGFEFIAEWQKLHPGERPYIAMITGCLKKELSASHLDIVSKPIDMGEFCKLINLMVGMNKWDKKEVA